MKMPVLKQLRYINSRVHSFRLSDLNNTAFTRPAGLNYQKALPKLFVRSYGSNAEEASFFSIGNKNIYIDAGKNTGLNAVKVKKLNGSVLEFKNLK
jgi:hypothetical protein